MRKTLTSQAGFSLIELMIVVAIIGILAAIAVPNYQGFQRKARQAEGKTMLGAIFTGEKAYFAEFQGYTDNLVKIGFSQDGNLRYNAGFSSAGTFWPALDTAPASLANANTTNVVCADATYGVNCVEEPGNLAIPAAIDTGANSTAGNATTIAVDQITFIAGAIGPLGGVQDDIWGMDEQKRLVNTQSGL